jgi:hypothetical protein
MGRKEPMYSRTCHVDADLGSMIIHFCNKQDISFEATTDGDTIIISVYDYKSKLDLLYRWMLKTLHPLGGSQRGKNIN